VMENKRYHIVIASIIFAIVTWSSVNLRNEFTVALRIPVILDDIRAGVALKYPVPKTVTAHFKGTGWALAGLYFSPDIKYYIDVPSLRPESFIVTGRDLMEHVKLPVTLQVVDVQPETLILALGEYKEKSVPLIPHVTLDYREGFGKVGPVRLVPESVGIGGTKNIVASISEWPTIYRKFENVRSDIDVDLPLEEPQNYAVQLSRASVRLHVSVQPFAEKTFAGIRVTATGAPAGREVVFIPSRMDIIVRGGIEQLSRISSSDFQATVDYQSLVEDSSGAATPSVTAPADVKVISRKPERLQFIIRKRM